MSMALDNNPQPAPQGAADAPLREAGRGAPGLPDDAIILVAVRNLVMFPGMILPISVGRGASVAGAQAAVKAERPIGVLLQRNPDAERPGPDDLCRVGTVSAILRYVTTPDGSHHIVCQGQQRFRLLEYLEGYPFLAARVERIPEPAGEGNEIEARFLRLKERATQALQLLPHTPEEFLGAVQNITSPAGLADIVAGFLDVKPQEKQAILETIDLRKRLDDVLEMLAHRIEVLKL